MKTQIMLTGAETKRKEIGGGMLNLLVHASHMLGCCRKTSSGRIAKYHAGRMQNIIDNLQRLLNYG